MTSFAAQERQHLADLLAEAGPGAATLCGDWTTYDLAAHLVIRDRRPDAAPGIVLPALAGWTERVRRATKAKHAYPALVQRIRVRPWWSRPVEEAVNLVEFFVHHEDVRRAGPFEPRELGTAEEAALWGRLRSTARLSLRGNAARLVAPGYGEWGQAGVTVTGRPGELVLFCSGRQGVAEVHLDGPPAEVDRLRTARLGV